MGTGGSRYGAGRPGWKRKAEASLAFDVRRIAAKGLLRPGAFSWHWTNNYGEKVGNIGVRVAGDPEGVILTYQWTPYGSDPRNVECSLWIERTPCNYGGSRPWLLCPSCGRRCAVVYFGAPGGRYACRRCARVAYYSQSEDALDRMWRKQRKIEAKLERKGLHEKTKEKLWARWNEAEARKDRLFTMRMMPLMQRWGMSLEEILG